MRASQINPSVCGNFSNVGSDFAEMLNEKSIAGW